MRRLSNNWTFLNSSTDYQGRRLVNNLPRDRPGAASSRVADEPEGENCGTGAGGFAKGNKCAAGGRGSRAGGGRGPGEAPPEQLETRQRMAQESTVEGESESFRGSPRERMRESMREREGPGRIRGLKPRNERERALLQEIEATQEFEEAKAAFEERQKRLKEVGQESKQLSKQERMAKIKAMLDTSLGQIAKDIGGVAGAATSAIGGAIAVGAKGALRGARFIWERYGNVESVATIATIGTIAALAIGAPAFAPAAAAARAAIPASAGITSVLGGGGLGSVLGAGGSALSSVGAAGAAGTAAGVKAALSAGALWGAGIGLAFLEAKNMLSGFVGTLAGDPVAREVGKYKALRGFVPGMKNPEQKRSWFSKKIINSHFTTNQVPDGLTEDVYKMLVRLSSMMRLPMPDRVTPELIEEILGEKLAEANEGMEESPPDPSIEDVEREAAPMSVEDEDSYTMEGKYFSRNARMCWGKPCPGAGGMPAAKPDSGGSGSVEASVDRAHFYAKARGQAHREKGSSELGYKELERRKRRLRASDPRRTNNADDGWRYLDPTNNKINWREIGKRAAGTAFGAGVGAATIGALGIPLGGYAGYKLAKRSKTLGEFAKGATATTAGALVGGAVLGTFGGAAGRALGVASEIPKYIPLGQAVGAATGIAAGGILGGRYGYKASDPTPSRESKQEETKLRSRLRRSMNPMSDEELVEELNYIQGEMNRMDKESGEAFSRLGKKDRSKYVQFRDRKKMIQREIAARQQEKGGSETPTPKGSGGNCGTGAGGFKKGNTCGSGSKVTNAGWKYLS